MQANFVQVIETYPKSFGFSEALARLKKGEAVYNGNWNGKGMYLNVQFPDSNSKMSEPYIYMVTSKKTRVPWLASQQDLFSSAWQVADLHYKTQGQ